MMAAINDLPHEIVDIILLQTYPQISRFVCTEWHGLLVGKSCYLCKEAVLNDHIDLLIWAKANGCPCAEVGYWATIFNREMILNRFCNEVERDEWTYATGQK